MVGAGADSGRSFRGYSLLEVLIAIILLTTVFVGMTAYSRIQRRALGDTERFSEATRLALTQLEQVKTRMGDPIRFANTLDSLINHGKDSIRIDNVKMGPRSYSLDVTREVVEGSSALIRVKTRASWDNRKKAITLGKLVTCP